MDFREYDTRVAAYAVVVDEAGEHLLLTWYNGEGVQRPCWTLPGGGVEIDETCEQAAVREVYEETGLHVDLGRPLTTSSRVWRQEGRRPFKAVRVIYAATVTGGTLGTVEVGGSTDLARWVPLAEAPALTPRNELVETALGILGLARAATEG